ncbi:MAG: DNA repair protein RadA [Mycobacteriaceae bacterium]|nr:DNA repair protein RadA [Mycobacteriaceae bacterium]
MARTKSVYRCTGCGHEVAKWVGRCPDCGEWGSMDEARPLRAAAAGAVAGGLVLPTTPATPISQVDAQVTRAKPTGVSELDRVLGGGLVPGSVVLLSGEPGVGKSTLLLEVAHRWAERSAADRALYVTAEESAGQVRMRADRTGSVADRMYLAAESDLATVLGHIEQVKPSMLVVDSAQTMLATGTEGVVGGVTQVRAVASALTSLAKTSGIAVVLVGHVTKDGNVAGPRTLEHLVDVVLHFEGDKHSTLRTLRGLKNRFGTTDELGCFELREEGITCVTDPSGLFLHHRTDAPPGTAVTVTMDGKRPLVGEVQALTAKSNIPVPRRAVSGLDFNRVAMVLAVLQKHGNVTLFESDVYTATVGGMRMTEPAADLALALAVASAAKNKELQSGLVALGEVGLAGEVRRVTAVNRRLAEAERLGFTQALVPPGTESYTGKIRVIRVGSVREALAHCGVGGDKGDRKSRGGPPSAPVRAPKQALPATEG